MNTANKPTLREIKQSANRALYQRFMDLPRSEREKMQAELEDLKLWWHFKSHLVPDGKDLGEAKIRAVLVISAYLGVTVKELADNKVDFVPYEVFSAKRQMLVAH